MKLDSKLYQADTLAIHAGQIPDPSTGAIMTPVYQTSTYVQEGPGVHKGFEYARTQNPTRFALEANLAALESASYGLCFSSGCGAMTNVLMTFQAGDHFVVCDDVYGGTRRLMSRVLSKCGFSFSFVDMTQLKNVEDAIQKNTKLLWIETPTNPTLKVIDIGAMVSLGKKRGLKTLVDNTFSSPYLQSPIKLGADYVLHSTTKYLGGHSDVVGGFIGTNSKEDFEALKFNQNSLGAIPGPWDCFLTLRGTKTLHVRMQRHSENAMVLADWLSKHSDVEKVFYPGLKSHPQHEIARKQMKAFGGMISFVVKGGLPKSKKVLENTKVFACAESLGGVESLIEHPAIMTHGSVPADVRASLGISDGLIRLSVGIEHIDDLRADLEQALKA